MNKFNLLTLVQRTFTSRNYYIDYPIKIDKKSLHSQGEGKNPVVPAMVYTNSDLYKLSIIKDNKGKAGVYRWTNKKNGKSYVGSAVNLARRFPYYYSLNLITNSNMSICKALLKHGHSNFNLEILEYCEPQNVIAREQYYLDLLQPEYNILKIAGSCLGYKHTEEARLNIIKYNTGRKHSEETIKNWEPSVKGKIMLCLDCAVNIVPGLVKNILRKLLINDLGGKIHSENTRIKISKTLGHRISVIEIATGVTSYYDSIGKASDALGSSHTTISRYIRTGKLFRGIYKIAKVEI